MFEIVRTEIINMYYDNSLARHFGIKKSLELIAQKYNLLMSSANIKIYIKKCDIYLALQLVKYKSHSNL